MSRVRTPQAGLPLPAAFLHRCSREKRSLLLHEYSHGIPRTINVIADNALLGGFAMGQRQGHQATGSRSLC